MRRNNFEPFGSITLCLSGGGYRAAAFHLGVFSYLNRIGLLEKVSTLSTVSGGTIVGAAYVYLLKNAQPFEKFYDTCFAFLQKVNLVKLGLNSLGEPSSGVLGYHNLICSLADAYDQELFFGARFGMLWDSKRIHLENIIFNATEFRTGIAFRFQKRGSGGLVGNRFVSISKDEAKLIRFADIVAASSCFPGGFEPLAFPDDFRWPGDEVPSSLKKQFPHPLPLMDGGVYDNQGIDSAMKAIGRANSRSDLFFISDTTQPRDELYPFPKKQKVSKLSLGWVNVIVLVLATLSLFGSMSLQYQLVSLVSSSGKILYGALAFGLPAVVSGGLAFFILWARSKIKNEILRRIPMVGLAGWNNLKRLSIDQLADLIQLRITSLFSLASSVFMKRIRSLVFSQVYENEAFKGGRIANLIYDLSEKRKHVSSWLKPSSEALVVVEGAVAAPTTLWFSKESDLRDLVACGELSTCYNLIDFIIRRDGKETSRYNSDVRKLFRVLKEDWNDLNEDPFRVLARGAVAHLNATKQSI